MATSIYLDALQTICQPTRASDFPRSLTPMRHLLAELGDPQKQYPAVVVAGSVGKGTTCHHIARLLRAADLRVGLYTSPHLHSFRERFCVDGEMISRAEFVDGVRAVHDAIQAAIHEPGESPTVYSTFERATALALWWFAQRRVDIAVLEIGIGGRWDAVNSAPNVLAVFAPIESEHLVMLGGSLQSVAWGKAGIIRYEGHAITCTQSADVMAILQDEADQRRARLLRVETGFGSRPQEAAAYLAMAAYRDLLDRQVIARTTFRLSPDPITLPGRQERVKVGEREALIDGGHTPLAARALNDAIDALVRPSQSVRMVIGMLQDKSVKDYLSVFDSPRFHLVLTQAPGHRALAARALANQAHLAHAHVEVIPELEEALAQVHSTDEPLFVVAGSLRMAAAARESYGLLSADELAEAHAMHAIFEGEDYLARLR